MRIFYLTFIALMMLTIAPANASDETLVLFDRYNPPYMFEDIGKASGLYPAIVTLVFEKMGKPVTCKAVPWKRALDLGSTGEAGVGGIYKTEPRQLIYDYSDPIYTERLLVYVNKTDDFEYKNLESLKGKTVGVLQGWSYGDAFDAARDAKLFQAVSVHTDRHNFKKLAQHRLDCVIATQAGAALVMNSGDYGTVRASKIPLAINPTHLVFGKLAKEPLIREFNTILRQIKKSGEYRTLLREHGVLSEMK